MVRTLANAGTPLCGALSMGRSSAFWITDATRRSAAVCVQVGLRIAWIAVRILANVGTSLCGALSINGVLPYRSVNAYGQNTDDRVQVGLGNAWIAVRILANVRTMPCGALSMRGFMLIVCIRNGTRNATRRSDADCVPVGIA